MSFDANRARIDIVALFYKHQQIKQVAKGKNVTKRFQHVM